MKRILLATALLTMLFGLASAQPQDPPAEPQPLWKSLAAKTGLDEKGAKQLERDKLIIADKPLRQSFCPYTKGELPVFVTSDFVLNAFHALLRETLRACEAQNAKRLPYFLKHILAELPRACRSELSDDGKSDAEKKTFESALPKARRIVHVALMLLGEDLKLEGDEAKLLAATVDLILKAEGASKPDWLGKPDLGFLTVDWTRFKPVGQYAATLSMQQYFRALRWLQTVPFRVHLDEEFAAICLIAGAAGTGDPEVEEEHERLTGRIRTVFGTGDDLDIESAWSLSSSWNTLADRRTRTQEQLASESAINDQLRFMPEDPREVAERSIRFLSASRLPDAAMFQRTTDSRQVQRAVPAGLEVATMLGSAFAEETLKETAPAPIVDVARSFEPLLQGSGLYCDYLRVLQRTTEPAEPDAPNLFSRRPWQIKNCNTVLAGWAQMRHAFSLQSKYTIYVLLHTEQYAGFVEPAPELFGDLAALCERLLAKFRQLGVFDVDTGAIAQELLAYAKLVEDKKLIEDDNAWDNLTGPEHLLRKRGESHAYVLGFEDAPESLDRKDAQKLLVEWLRSTAAQIMDGTFPRPDKFASALDALDEYLPPLWRNFCEDLHRIEGMAHKQLRGKDFNTSEQAFLRNVGKRMAAAMFYGGNSWVFPRDDSPHIATVFSNPLTGQHLQVGISRPRPLYILYPWKGTEVLCVGAVMPYYEFLHPTRLNDNEWKDLLRNEACPPIPGWLAPIVQDGRLKDRPENDD